jgi:hypothetical protein
VCCGDSTGDGGPWSLFRRVLRQWDDVMRGMSLARCALLQYVSPDVVLRVAGYQSSMLQCEQFALLSCRERGAVLWRDVVVDAVEQHIAARGWSHLFTHSVDSGSRLVSDWPLHLLRPFGATACFLCVRFCGRAGKRV